MVKSVDEMTLTTCMEQLQEGYVQSVAATAGLLSETINRDEYGIDFLITRKYEAKEEISLKVQLKNSTKQKPDPARSHFSFQFRHRQHLERLVMRRTTQKAILVVMASPPDQMRWTQADHDHLKIRHCCYWMNLEGHSIADGVKSPTVRVPTANIFDAGALGSILDRLERGETL